MNVDKKIKESEKAHQEKILNHKKASQKLFKVAAIIIIVAVILFVVGKILTSYQSGQVSPDTTKNTEEATSTALTISKQTTGPTLTINNKKFSLEIADTPALQTQGLSDRDSLPQDHGMLFVFDQPGVYPFWMKDMHFNLDIIFLDAQYKVITIYENLSPNTYPKSFAPSQPEKYVLEVNAGFSKEYGLKPGMTLDIVR